MSEDGRHRWSKIVDRLFVVFAILSVASAVFHLTGIFNVETRPGYPWQRHLFWVFANLIFCWFLIKRSGYFIPVLGLLTVQQLYGHGGELMRIWWQAKQISVIDLAVVIVMPLVLFLYIYDRLESIRP